MARVVREAVQRLLPHMPGLRLLNAARCYKLTSVDVATILKCCPQLQALHLQVVIAGLSFRSRSVVSAY
jgi:hypothetical protein